VVAKPAGERGGAHVGDEEPEGEGSDALVGEAEVALDQLLDPGEEVAVDEVDEVEGGEEDESGGGSGNLGDGKLARGVADFGHVVEDSSFPPPPPILRKVFERWGLGGDFCFRGA